MVNLTDEFNKNIPDSLGTAGQVLTVNSGATAGEWADAAGGSWNLLSTINASSSSTVEFTSGITGYDAYAVVVSNAVPSTGGARLQLRMKRTTDSSFITSSVYSYTTTASDVFNSGTLTSASTGQNRIDLCGFGSVGTSSTIGGHSGVYYFTNLGDSARHATIFADVLWFSGADSPYRGMVGGVCRVTGVIDGLQYLFLDSSANISTGKFSLYGLSV
jgi:hypothetical protein